MKAKKDGPKKPERVRDRAVVSVYVEPEVLDRLDKLCGIERRSRGSMVHEILRRYFDTREAMERSHAAAS